MLRFFQVFILVSLSYMNSTFTACLGQGSSVRFKIGYGTYQMNQLKDLQKAIVTTLPVRGKATQSFPAYWNFQMKYLYKTSDKNRIGAFIDYASTGGRIAYSDYSGELKVDNVVSRYGLGVSEEYVLAQKDALSLSGLIEASALYSRLMMDSFVKINDQSQKDLAKLKSLGLALEPGLLGEGKISKMTIGLSVGYQLSFCKPFHLKGERKAILTNTETNKKVNPNWSGIRLGATIGINF